MKKKKLAIASLLMALLMPLGATPLAAYAEGEDAEGWYVSRSKTATDLDENYVSQVTLSLPNEEETLASDVVFVMDKSECGNASSAAAKELVSQLLAQKELENAKIKCRYYCPGRNSKSHSRIERGSKC